nr:MAG TPA: zinc-ribbon domain protein [Caudoviricetes sp.]
MVQLKDITMLNDTDFKIEKMKMLKRIGEAVKDFVNKTGYDNVSIGATCCDGEFMTHDGKMHEGLHIDFTCDYCNPEWDEEDDE